LNVHCIHICGEVENVPRAYDELIQDLTRADE